MCDCILQLVGFVSLSPASDLEFDIEATEIERLLLFPRDSRSNQWPTTALGDWPAYRFDNRRCTTAAVDVPSEIKQVWESKLPPSVLPTAPITSGGLMFVGNSVGMVWAWDVHEGQLRWKLYTGGSIIYPPAVEDGRLFVGRGDG